MMKTKRFNFECSEDKELKLQVLTGRSFLQPRDVQQLLDSLIDKAYENRKR
jgi:hypothetical protein